MTKSRELAALARRHAAIEAEVAEKARELEEAGHLLEEARRRRRLPVLEALRISSPCRADWSKMDGDDRVRHCGDCKKHVYNLSAMTHVEALELIESLERAPCVRYYERPDGTILFSDCAVVRSRRRRGRLLTAGAALAVGAGMAALAAMPPDKESDFILSVITDTQPGEEPYVVMGAIRETPPDEEPDFAQSQISWSGLGPEGRSAFQLEDEKTSAERALPEALQRELAVKRAEVVALGRPGTPSPPPDRANLGAHRETFPSGPARLPRPPKLSQDEP